MADPSKAGFFSSMKKTSTQETPQSPTMSSPHSTGTTFKSPANGNSAMGASQALSGKKTSKFRRGTNFMAQNAEIDNPAAKTKSIDGSSSMGLGAAYQSRSADLSRPADITLGSPYHKNPSFALNDTPQDETVLATAAAFSPNFPVSDPEVGPQHFTKLKLLGVGGVGKVYLVLLKGTDKLFAMKTLTKEDMIKKNKVKRVMTEREILATSNHPFIVTMYASFQTENRLCFVMEFCEGGEFFKVLQQQPKKRLKEDMVRFYVAEVLLALEYLHHGGFIYRDLKPENILMRGSGHIALTDFDLSTQTTKSVMSPKVIQKKANLIEQVKGAFSLKKSDSKLSMLELVGNDKAISTESNSFVGTEEYIAPEIVIGDAGQTSAVDWWTLGILAYEMLCGFTPFKGSNIEETFANITNSKDKLKFPEDVDISANCKDFIKGLLTREADKRLGSAQGASELKRHKFFKDTNFTLIRNNTPPIIPKFHDFHDMSQYKEIKDEDEEQHADADKKIPNPLDPFENFNLRRDSEIITRPH